MIKNLVPKQCWRLLQENSDAILIDVRTTMEHSFVGHPPGAINIAWKDFPDMQLNNLFVSQVEKLVKDKEAPILLLCRSGQRSLAGAKALEDSGYHHLINITEGFEGTLDDKKHRGNIDGWKFHGLPWTQS
ncbi:MAG: rhodanese-like domain-containing protein [Methylococcales bacterium]|nr:rhodanese-like domain-containing protein [Methylococcales bacterium]